MKKLDIGTKAFQTLDKDKKERILTAALEEFALNGYRHASMNSVVKKAGISKGSLFWYFESKSLLFSAIVDAAVDQVKESLREIRSETAEMCFFARLERFIRAGVRFIDEHPFLARIYFHLLQSDEAPFGAERVLEIRKLGVNFFSELILEGIKRSDLRSDISVPHVAFLMNSLLEGLLRGYYMQFIGKGFNIYHADGQAMEQWIYCAMDLLKKGMSAGETGSIADSSARDRLP